MIGKDEIATAVRSADAAIDGGQLFAEFWSERAVDPDGLIYVAKQRALRGILVLRGENLQDKPFSVQLSASERRIETILTAMFLDGFAARGEIKGLHESKK